MSTLHEQVLLLSIFYLHVQTFDIFTQHFHLLSDILSFVFPSLYTPTSPPHALLDIHPPGGGILKTHRG
jgi:hypothetical protein